MSLCCAYRFSLKEIIGRSKERSVINSAAYISRLKLKNNELDKTFDYWKDHSPVLHSEVLIPSNAPEWMRDIEQLWNEVEYVENRSNSQFARQIELNLPFELLQHEQIYTLKNYIEKTFISQGMIVHMALHEPDSQGDKRNYHAHLLITMRRVNELGFTGNKVREWNDKSRLLTWRENWALECARTLEYVGLYQEAKRWEYGHLTLDKQYQKALERNDFEYARACDHEPTKHKGRQIHQMEKRGVISYVQQDREQDLEIAQQIQFEKITELSLKYQALIHEKEELEIVRFQQEQEKELAFKRHQARQCKALEFPLLHKNYDAKANEIVFELEVLEKKNILDIQAKLDLPKSEIEYNLKAVALSPEPIKNERLTSLEIDEPVIEKELTKEELARQEAERIIKIRRDRREQERRIGRTRGRER